MGKSQKRFFLFLLKLHFRPSFPSFVAKNEFELGGVKLLLRFSHLYHYQAVPLLTGEEGFDDFVPRIGGGGLVGGRPCPLLPGPECFLS